MPTQSPTASLDPDRGNRPQAPKAPRASRSFTPAALDPDRIKATSEHPDASTSPINRSPAPLLPGPSGRAATSAEDPATSLTMQAAPSGDPTAGDHDQDWPHLASLLPCLSLPPHASLSFSHLSLSLTGNRHGRRPFVALATRSGQLRPVPAGPAPPPPFQALPRQVPASRPCFPSSPAAACFAWSSRTVAHVVDSSPCCVGRLIHSASLAQLQIRPLAQFSVMLRSVKIRSTTRVRLFYGFGLLPSGIPGAGTGNAMI